MTSSDLIYHGGAEQRELDPATLLRLCTRFYAKAFADPHLDRFFRSHDDPHAQRLADWMMEKMTGGAMHAWSDERRVRPQVAVPLADGLTTIVHDRTSAHVAAWHCLKREPEKVGRRFKLDDCRVWMRLMLWSAREEGLLRSAELERRLQALLERFVVVYERSAGAFVEESLRWSEGAQGEANIQRYLQQGNWMTDVVAPPH